MASWTAARYRAASGVWMLGWSAGEGGRVDGGQPRGILGGECLTESVVERVEVVADRHVDSLSKRTETI